MRKQQGFTLVEIAIVLVIIGLLLGGILRGQELIQGARVRNIIDQQNGIKAAFFGFQDRYRGIPGDLTAAQVQQIGGGVLAAANLAGNGLINPLDSSTAFQNLTTSGFLACSVCTLSGIASDASNSPVNVYGGVLQIVTDGNLASLTAANVYATIQPGGAVINNIKTGNLIPSNVMAEADVKVDNGNPYSGNLVFSVWAPAGGTAPTQANCAAGPAGAIAAWNNGQATTPPGGTIDPNCGGATKL